MTDDALIASVEDVLRQNGIKKNVHEIAVQIIAKLASDIITMIHSKPHMRAAG